MRDWKSPSWEKQTEEVSPDTLESKLEDYRLINEKVALYRVTNHNSEHDDYNVEFRLFFKYKDKNDNLCYTPREYITYNEIDSWHREETVVNDTEIDSFKNVDAEKLTEEKTIYEISPAKEWFLEESIVKPVKNLVDELKQ